MKIDTNKILECYACGLFVHNEFEESSKLKCPRCNSKLKIEKKQNLDSFYYSISALLLFILLNLYPLVSLSLNGKDLQATLLKTPLILFEQKFYLVSGIIVFTIILAPLLNSLFIILSFIQINTKIKIFSDSFIYDGFHFFKTWGFLEVFAVSIIVTYIKLIGMVSTTKFDIGFYILLAYIFCFYMSNVKFENKTVLGE